MSYIYDLFSQFAKNRRITTKVFFNNHYPILVNTPIQELLTHSDEAYRVFGLYFKERLEAAKELIFDDREIVTYLQYCDALLKSCSLNFKHGFD